MSEETLGDAQYVFFEANGYLRLERFLVPQRLERLRESLEARYALEGEDAGGEQPGTRQNVRRLCNLFAKGEPFLDLAIDPVVLEMAHHVIGPQVRWQAFNAHDPLPGQFTRQAIHADRQFFPGCAAYLNVLVALDDLTDENGATRLVPGSHRYAWPRLELPDREAALAPVDGEILLTAPAGSVVFVHGDTWHGARDNQSAGTRRVLHLGFACPNTAPQYEIAATLPPSYRIRLGPLAEMLAPVETLKSSDT